MVSNKDMVFNKMISKYIKDNGDKISEMDMVNLLLRITLKLKDNGRIIFLLVIIIITLMIFFDYKIFIDLNYIKKYTKFDSFS